MLDRVIIVIKTASMTVCDARLQVLGLTVRGAVNADGFSRSPYRKYERANSPIDTDVDTGEMYFAMGLSQAQAAKLPRINTPNFTVVYDSREEEDVWPTFTANVYDADGNITGTTQQDVGRIA